MDVMSLVSLLSKLSRLPKDYPAIRELDINPLMLNENGVVVADARIIFNGSVVEK